MEAAIATQLETGNQVEAITQRVGDRAGTSRRNRRGGALTGDEQNSDTDHASHHPPHSPPNTELSCEAPNAGFVSFNSLLGDIVILASVR
jgi:hypothetical protein